jgi:hypothetical protein
MQIKQAFINGFISRAQETGVLTQENSQALAKQASETYDSLVKKAMPPVGVGLVGDAMAFGVPSLIGAAIGHNYSPISDRELRDEMAYHEDPSISKALKYALIPGYLGYRAAKVNRLDQAYQKYRDEHRADNTQ